jgi:glycine oxidase
VVIVGAGIIGCSIAYELSRRGASVRVVDGRSVGDGATQASAGVLAPYIEGGHGAQLLELGARSLSLYDDFVARVTVDADLPVRYARTGTLQVGTDESAASDLEQAFALAAPVGARMLDRAEVRELEPHVGDGVLGGVLVPVHGFVGASELTIALSRAAARRGVTFGREQIEEIRADGNEIVLKAARAALVASTVIIAAGSWSAELGIPAATPLPVRPVRGQLLKLRWDEKPLARVLWGPRCYLVPWPDGSILLGATVENVGFDERATVAGVRDLLDAACELLPRAWTASFEEVRVGLRPASPDDLPIVGRSARFPGIVYATGHYRSGVLLAPLTAAVVADLIMDNREDTSLAVMSPARFGH